MKKFCFLFNPSVNRERSFAKFKELKEITGDWADVEYLTSENSNHLKVLAKQAAQNFEVVVACGGDGTVGDIAVSIKDYKAKLGIIPLGSGNDFSKALGLSSNLHQNLNILYHRKYKKVDLGRCNNRYFINTLGFGFDGQTNFYAGKSSITSGSLRYAVSALKTVFKMIPFEAELSVDHSKIVKKQWIMLTAANGRVEGGNFIIAPNASPFNGTLTFVTISPVSKWILPFLLPLFTIGKQTGLPYINYYKAKRIALHFERPVFMHSDGEQVQTGETNFDIRVVPSAIRVIC